MINPVSKSRIMDTYAGANGKSIVSGALPSTESRMIFFLPYRSARGPPKKVPSAPAAKNAKMKICADRMENK